MSINYMSIKEFQHEGYLQEVNRQFFHPLGLALEVKVDTNKGWVLSGIWDYRDDSEGMRYDDEPNSEKVRKQANIEKIARERKPVREKSLGYWVQPIKDIVDTREEDTNEKILIHESKRCCGFGCNCYLEAIEQAD